MTVPLSLSTPNKKSKKQKRINFKDLGFVNTEKMFEAAMKGGFSVPAYNFNNMEQLQAIITGCLESQSPVILQVSRGARKYANPILLRNMAKGAVEMMKSMAAEKGLEEIPIVLHLDHGDSFEVCKACIDAGFSSIMIDGSELSFEDNIDLTKKVVDYAHKYNVTVEGELGVLAGIATDKEGEINYTDPDDVVEFVTKTGVDSLAISIGTSHGANKFKPRQCTRDPKTGVLILPPSDLTY